MKNIGMKLSALTLTGIMALASQAGETAKTTTVANKPAAVASKPVRVAQAEQAAPAKLTRKQAHEKCKAEGKKGKDLKACVKDLLGSK